jgi:hypothetical protein
MAFLSCTSVTIPSGATKIGNSAFSGCSGLASVTIGNSVTSIGDHAFRLCDSLTSVTIPNSVISIGSQAFAQCDSLTSITIPNSVTSIGEYAFYNCESLIAINVAVNNSAYTSENGVLYNKNKTLLHTYPARKTGAFFTIPNSVTIIGGGAFAGCTSLTSITIPNSVSGIGHSAFRACTNLTSVTFQGTVASNQFAYDVFAGDDLRDRPSQRLAGNVYKSKQHKRNMDKTVING